MTNREKLMAELAGLDNAAFYMALAENDAVTAMENRQCEDCAATLGPCPCPDGEAPCRLPTEEWMDWECRQDRILREGRD